jgi:hypothetical protein
VPAKDRNAWTLGGILTRSAVYKYLGVVYQEDGSWQTRAKALARCKQPMGFQEPLLVIQQSADKVRLLMVQTFIYSAVMYARKCGTRRRRSRDKMSAVVRKLSAAF